MDLPLRYCVRCVMPETQEGQEFDIDGFCNVCRSSEEKMRIDWKARRVSLESILQQAKEDASDQEYDCLVPISGGKDSTFQLHVLVREFGMRPLTVTFSHNWFSAIGMFNLFNAIECFDVDNVLFTPRRKLVNSLAKKSLEKIGDACWHCHAGVGAFPLRVAKDYGIKLVIWGESVAESSSRGTYASPILTFDQEYFTRVSAKKGPQEFLGDGVEKRDLRKFEPLSKEDYEASKIKGIHLGDFIFWDEERQTEFVQKEYGWREDKVEGTYKGYKSAECVMPGVHDFACYLKRGYGRTSFHLSSDIRSGLISREDITEEMVNIERSVPGAFDYYKEITGISLDEFKNTLKGHRHPSLLNVELPIIEDGNNKRNAKQHLFLERLRKWLDNDNEL